MKKYYLLFLLCIIPFSVQAKSKYLYDVFKDAAENGLAQEYTGAHKDSFTEEGNKKIYYWYSTSTENNQTIINSNHIIFAGQCWQMIRTTDTGGVKIIYNGEAEDGQCLKTRGTHVGYNGTETNSLLTTYYYGSDYTYDKETNTFSLSGDISTGSVKIGQYTCRKTSGEATCSNLYYVESRKTGNNYIVFGISGGSANSQYGNLYFNPTENTPAYAGYMYKTTYPSLAVQPTTTEMMTPKLEPVNYNNIWFAESYDYNTETRKYTLVNPYKVMSSEVNPQTLVGKYTLSSSNENYTNGAIRMITACFGTTISYMELSGGHDLSYYDVPYVYGTSYTKNEDNTYTINDPTFFMKSEWGTKWNMGRQYICKNPVDNKCTELWRTNNNEQHYFVHLSSSDTYKYASGFTYENGEYTLSGDTVEVWSLTDSNETNQLNTHHYTCRNTTGKCNTLYYIYYIWNLGTLNVYYVELTNGIGIEEALQNMLLGEDINQKDSLMKKGIDLWYERYLLDYSDYLEDTIFCNERTIYNPTTHGWNANGGRIDKYITYGQSTTLDCPREIDQFSVSNPKAKLKYPVALLTYAETKISNNTGIRLTGETYWLLTPSDFRYSNSSYHTAVGGNGSETYSYVDHNYGVRPAVSLKPKTRILSGDGSRENPYTIDNKVYYSVDVEIKNETKEFNIELEDFTSVQEGEDVNFKVTPIKGYKVNQIQVIDSNNQDVSFEKTGKNEYHFVMPASDVTIIPTYQKVDNAVNVEDNQNTKEIKIEVNDVQAVVYEEMVRFTVAPEEGYEVETITIIDEENNNIEYHKTEKENEYEFIMPDTDVLIKPTYRKIDVPASNDNNSNKPIVNPNTRNSLLLIVLIVFGAGFIVIKTKKSTT